MYFSDITPQEQPQWWFYEKNVIDESTICKIDRYVKDNELKSDVINQLKKPSPIFIDDSFKERKDVFLNCSIPSITPEEINYLI